MSTNKHINTLKRVLGPFDLVMMGVGCIIGVGIYILSGVAAADYAGPAVILSFLLAGGLCGIVAMAYGELASMFPLAGSAYSYSYFAFGRGIAWFIGWTLLLEYIVAASAVASGWSSYFRKLLHDAFGIAWPEGLGSPFLAHFAEGFSIDLPAMLIVFAITGISLLGIKESARFNNIIAGVKIVILLLFIGFGIAHIDPANWQPFIPDRIATERSSIFGSFWELPVLEMFRGIANGGDFSFADKFWHYGLQGVLTGAAIVFFTYVGFDMVSATAEETKNPQRDLPIGIFGSLLVATLLYIGVALVLTGIVPPTIDGMPNPALTNEHAGAPLAVALSSIGAKSASIVLCVGALAGVTTTLLALSLGVSRILMNISRDGMLPNWFAQIHHRFQTPHFSILSSSLLVALIASSLPIGDLGKLCNLGTLAAFTVVCGGVIVLRNKHPELARGFKCPGMPWLPCLGATFCVVLLLSLPIVTWIWFALWSSIGLILYWSFGRTNAPAFPSLPSKEEQTV